MPVWKNLIYALEIKVYTATLLLSKTSIQELVITQREGDKGARIAILRMLLSTIIFNIQVGEEFIPLQFALIRQSGNLTAIKQ